MRRYFQHAIAISKRHPEVEVNDRRMIVDLKLTKKRMFEMQITTNKVPTLNPPQRRCANPPTLQ